ncbi:MAG: hypothetical protein KC418_16300 [Anaerolineales bacterium]|nr:hypothetical protein [Anaerolineales bacterium]MCB8953847.1 hypothetical protein [Ardenticatenales bacterium]
MKAKRKPRKKATASTTNPTQVLRLLGGAFVLVGVVGYVLQDALKYPLRGLGSVIWMMALGVTFLLGVGYFAQFLLPAKWEEGLILLGSFYAISLRRLLGQAQPVATNSKDAPPNPLEELPASFRSVRAGILESHIALALARGNSFSRAAGPGYVRLESGETIRHVIDLRRHIRRQEVKARSRDGIPINTSVTVIFQVRRPSVPPTDERLPFPYDRDAVFRVSYAGSVDQRSNFLPWSERVCPQAVAGLIAQLSCYNLDQIYGSHTAADNLLPVIERQLKEQLRDQFAPKGIDIIGVSVGLLDLPANVVEQRIQNCQANWQKQVNGERATVTKNMVEKTVAAQAEVQREVIINVAKSLNTIKETGVDPPQVFIMHVLQAMEQAIAQDVRESRVTADVLLALSRLRTTIDGTITGDGGE